MAVRKKKIGKKIYFEGAIWDVMKIISPNKFDDFILISRKRIDIVHKDGKSPVDIACLDAHNDDFCPLNNKTKSVIEKMQKLDKDYQCARSTIEEKLTAFWLACFPDIN